MRRGQHGAAIAKGGEGAPDNGQVLCRDCNIKKSDKEP
ncbi:HNH endonuclease [Cystobacter fuscus]